ncbi:ATP-binding protein [Agathobaculum sp. LCP25S3_E8]|uniref:ATP-binding protein n=1 Tax=Agathobaculum sp. LCP25S3_E8 TaxID=3438735 RepID=UPI003F8E3A82
MYGERFRPSQAAREGSAVPPHLKVTLSNGIVVERKGKNQRKRAMADMLAQQVDTLQRKDWAELMCTQYVCDKYQKKSIEEFGYGKGYTYLSEEFGRLLNQLSEVVERGVHVVVTAHAKMRKFEQPDELGAYDRWEMKLSAKNAPLVKEWADMVLFASYKTYAVKTESGKVKGQGGERRMYTAHHPCWDAKKTASALCLSCRLRSLRSRP